LSIAADLFFNYTEVVKDNQHVLIYKKSGGFPMFNKYLITGASGFLGRTVITELKNKNAEVRALVLEGDPLARDLPVWVNVVYGDVCDNASLDKFFDGADSETCVIHCAGIVSVASRSDNRIYQVNAGGTSNILRHCEKGNIGKLVYVSSVHAIPEKPKGTEITEDAVISPEQVTGAYARSKAIATSAVFRAAERGLNASVVFPSGIIGPGDTGTGSITCGRRICQTKRFWSFGYNVRCRRVKCSKCNCRK